MVCSTAEKNEKYLPTVDKLDIEVQFVNIDFLHGRHRGTLCSIFNNF